METMVLGPWNCLIQEKLRKSQKYSVQHSKAHTLSRQYLTCVSRNSTVEWTLLPALFFCSSTSPSYFYFFSTSFLYSFCTYISLPFFFVVPNLFLLIPLGKLDFCGDVIEKKGCPFTLLLTQKLLKFDLFKKTFWDLTGKQMVCLQP